MRTRDKLKIGREATQEFLEKNIFEKEGMDLWIVRDFVLISELQTKIEQITGESYGVKQGFHERIWKPLLLERILKTEMGAKLRELESLGITKPLRRTPPGAA